MTEQSKVMNEAGASPVSAPVGTKAERPKRIQRKRTKGWRMPENTVSVTRPGPLGNPFSMANAIEAGYLKSALDPLANLFLVDCFRDWITEAGARGDRDWWAGPESDARKAAIKARLPSLRGKNLACFCAIDQPCHADVLLDLANSPKQAASRQGEDTGSGDKDPEAHLVPPEAKE